MENWKIHKYAEIKQHASEQPMVKKEIKRKTTSILRQMKMETQHTTPMGCSQSSPERAVHRTNAFVRGKNPNEQPKFIPQGTTTKTIN